MDTAHNSKNYFTRSLIRWHHTANFRSLPWKNEKDPYKIWLSEIILQQTRAQQGLPYYLRFTEAYPTITDMATAPDEEVFRLWQGLGYYNRCKNMLATARFIAHELNGKFPTVYEEILQLKGIGPYTAAAIASFAFGLPHAVVDGNVYRALGRYFGIDAPFDTTEGKKIYTTLAQELLDTNKSAAYNQAIMDLGATVCTPQAPRCDECPLRKNCFAYEQKLIDMLPVRSKKLTIRKRYFHYLLLKWNDTIWIHKRTGRDIWENLHEPYLVEHPEPLNDKQLVKYLLSENVNLSYSTLRYKDSYKQRLTHQLIETHFFTVELTTRPDINATDGNWMHIKDLNKFAFPKTIVSFFKKNLYF